VTIEGLASVDLNGCAVTSAGLMHLTASGKTVKKMNLTGTRVNSLDFVKEFPSVVILDLSSCRAIDDSSLDELDTAGQIGFLDLSNTSVTEKGIERIAQKGFLQDGSIRFSILPILAGEAMEEKEQAMTFAATGDGIDNTPRGIRLHSVMQMLRNERSSRKLDLFGQNKGGKIAESIYQEISRFRDTRNDTRKALEYFSILNKTADRAGVDGLPIKRDCLYGIGLCHSKINPKTDIRKFLAQSMEASRKIPKKDESKTFKDVLWRLYCLEIDSGHYRSALKIDNELAFLIKKKRTTHIFSLPL
jgi:hypothetical protein